MSMRRTVKEFRKHRRFFGVMLLLALVIGTATAYLSNGLNGLFDKASLAQKALDNPATLTEAEKTELKKAFPDKASAKAAYDSLGDDQKEKARQALGAMSESEKAQYRDRLR